MRFLRVLNTYTATDHTKLMDEYRMAIQYIWENTHMEHKLVEDTLVYDEELNIFYIENDLYLKVTKTENTEKYNSFMIQEVSTSVWD